MGGIGTGCAWHSRRPSMDRALLWLVGALAQALRVVRASSWIRGSGDLEPGKWLASLPYWRYSFATRTHELGTRFGMEPTLTSAQRADVQCGTDVNRRFALDADELRFQ